MYERFYDLFDRPFSASTDAACFFMSKQHTVALSSLQYSILTNAGLTLVTGDAGLGKTQLVRRMMSNLDDSIVVGLVSNTNADSGSILPWVLSAFGLWENDAKTARPHDVIEAFVEKTHKEQCRAVLLIDEAHNLNASALQEVRSLLDLHRSEGGGLQIALIGQTSLIDQLQNAPARPLAQRVSHEITLQPFDYETTDDYISYRLSFYGGKPEIFDYPSRASIYYHTRGIPRLINSVCDLALVYGYGDSLETIDHRIIRQVLLDKAVAMYGARKLDPDAEAVLLHSAILTSHNVDISHLQA